MQTLGGHGNRKPLISCPSPSTDGPEHFCEQGNLRTDCRRVYAPGADSAHAVPPSQEGNACQLTYPLWPFT